MEGLSGAGGGGKTLTAERIVIELSPGIALLGENRASLSGDLDDALVRPGRCFALLAHTPKSVSLASIYQATKE